MKTSLLKTVRKYFDYHISKDGKVTTRNKKSGFVKEYDSIEEYVKDLSYSDTLIGYLSSHKWNKKKQIIKEKKSIRSQEHWESLNHK